MCCPSMKMIMMMAMMMKNTVYHHPERCAPQCVRKALARFGHGMLESLGLVLSSLGFLLKSVAGWWYYS